ncbi:anthranilate synthase component I family protein [Spirosoma sordidisoli]|uniref:Anthranilate synthase component 1 n=1 Tax=Spirosoma sordidisoli TaxID=2502893 RepID=A0A4Q2UG32_9BACT|nr:anthranilate synthase component I family protein [Spirosoma sordidisoli]RYC68313.1 anthranilate synthase component I family protein [Spirosoma sordidisoli]
MTLSAPPVTTYRVVTRHKRMLADIITPVSIYLRIRDRFLNSILLESSDYHGNDNSFSYIAFDPVARFSYEGQQLTVRLPGQSEQVRTVESSDMLTALQQFKDSFQHEKLPFSFITNGLFGYFGYPAVQSFEDIRLQAPVPAENQIPAAVFAVYRYVIAINHFKDELYLFEHSYLQAGEAEPETSTLNDIGDLITGRNYPTYSFSPAGPEQSNFTDDEFRGVVQKGKDHCQRGDVFQIVLSRRFEMPFVGDEFNVYRSLRSLNPSPYLFYFDYGNYKLFGSSPESQIVVKDRKATIYPIAGTFRRTGDDAHDAELAQKLYDDPKESAEHVMLVDLARNDLSRNCDVVKVETFKEVQYYSHVIHLVSKVVGDLTETADPLQIVAETFPAGTLSGAPKHMAMRLIDRYENLSRSFYSGSIGYMGFDGEFNHCIMIRTFMSKDNTLYYQAGAGVVAKSVVESEVQEVHNKLAALRMAIEQAKSL